MAAETGDGDPLEALREQLERTQEAARALAREAAEAAAGVRARRPPPAGWQGPRDPDAVPGAPELTALLGLAESLRDALPPELVERLVAVARELLMAVRAVIDYLLEHMVARRAGPDEAQDIPIL